MGKIIILNGSPRAPRSNSKKYAEIFSGHCSLVTEYHNITKSNHAELCERLEGFSDILLVFPLYADSIPVTMLDFLKSLELSSPAHKPVISVLINCGFLEWEQNDTAVKMIRLFCRKNGYTFGSVLQIGSGEAILTTPFKFMVTRKIRKLASSITQCRYCSLHTSMPLPVRTFIRASSSYWESYGKRNGITRQQMETMKIEDK